MAAANSKEAQAHLIDPLNAPEPSSETGPGTHFRSTFGPAPGSTPTPSTTSPRGSLSSNNPFRDNASPTAGSSSKKAVQISERETTGREEFPKYRAEAFGDYNTAPRSSSGGKGPPAYDDATAGASSSGNGRGRRRTSSLKERFPGDESHKPLDVIRRDSKKAHRSPHLNKRHLPGPDVIDRLDPALGGRAYHHEGPYDAAALAKNTKNDKYSPVAALQTTNEEALKATPRENIKDAVNRHKPLDGVAFVPPGVPDQFGRTYEYEEGTDMAREPGDDAGYKRWPDREYDDEDHKGQSEPTFSLDRALQAHKIDDDGIEMEDRAHLNKDYHRAERNGTLDTRDPVEIAGNDGKYAELEQANVAKDVDADMKRGGSLRGLKNRIGSLRHRKHGDE
ncbi:hypothetical protein B0A55_00157 [Friedmanniomyces simplex]|uniref:Pal1 cell morphology protein n=1 Tax=Friedmanniomyces simplex TaxID=329884 RepID=A0A4U0Y0F6_9PEZI|nr:hypothetical protein B0A55_00157 [Friedmanniomyces simplex]